MSVLEQKHAIERQINDLFMNVMSMSNDAFQKGASVQDLLNMKNRLTEAFENAMQISIQAKQFNETVERNKINIGTKSTLGRSLGTIKLKLSSLRDIFLVYLRQNTSSLNSAQVDEIHQFLNSRIVTKFVGNGPPVLPLVNSPVRRARSPSVAPRYPSHRSSVIPSPSAAANVFIRRISHPPEHAPQVVSSEHVIVNHRSPNKQTGCFGKICERVKTIGTIIKSRFSRNSVHPGSNVGGKRKLRRRTRRTRRGRHSRLH